MVRKLVCCLGVLTGCASSPSGPLSANDSTPPAPVEPLKERADAGADGSGEEGTDLAGYLKAGVPDGSQPWSPDGYRRATVALTELLAAGGTATLPRREGDDGVFARATNGENFAALSGSEPIADRVSMAQGWLSGFSGFARLYLSRAKQADSQKPLDLSAEQIALVRTLMDLLAVSADLHQAQLAASPGSEGAERALGQLKGTMGGAIQGALKMLSEREVYSAADREQLAEALVGLVPRMKKLFSPAQLGQLKTAVDTLLAAEPEASSARAALGRLASALG